MSENSNIEWTDHTFNPWIGCQKVGPGCDLCYAESWDARWSGGEAKRWGPGAPRTRTSAAKWREPLKWAREADAFAAKHGRRQRVFCASLADVFDNAVDPQWRADLFDLIRATPQLDWLLLTKRIGNAAEMLPEDWGGGWPHVWLGATVVNQDEADRDIPKLLETPAALRFLSVEPMLGAINISELTIGRDRHAPLQGASELHDPDYPGQPDEYAYVLVLGDRIDWVICGGESAQRRRSPRPMHPDWARSLRDQCAAAGTPFFFKQWGEWLPWAQWNEANIIDGEDDTTPSRFETIVWGDDREELDRFDKHQVNWVVCADYHHTCEWTGRVGKAAAGRVLDGQTHDAFPASPAEVAP